MRYLVHFALAVLLLVAALTGFNAWVDPYAVFRDHAAGDVPQRIMNERIFKTVKLAREPADVVFIGTSRSDIGIAREQPVLPGKRLVNLSTFGQPIYETRRLLERALQDGKPRSVVLGLDFFAFNALFDPPSDYVEDNYSETRKAALLLSVSTLSSGISRLRHPQPGADDCCYLDGFRTPNPLERLRGSYHHFFTASERMYLMEKYLPYPECTFAYARRGREMESTLQDLRAILELAHRNHIDLRLFVSPSHARQWETLAAGGLWASWEDWKRKLVALDEQEAKRAGQPPFPLWDFSGYDEVSSEELPGDGEPRLMENYSDSSHYTPAIGRRVVARLFGAGNDDWGTLLTSANVEAHLAAIRAARERYRAGHPRDVEEIAAIAREAERDKHCAGKP